MSGNSLQANPKSSNEWDQRWDGSEESDDGGGYSRRLPSYWVTGYTVIELMAHKIATSKHINLVQCCPNRAGKNGAWILISSVKMTRNVPASTLDIVWVIHAWFTTCPAGDFAKLIG